MSRLLKSQNYFIKCLGILLLFGFIIIGSIGGCENNGGSQDTTQALTENDFANDSALQANPQRGVIVHFLEPPDSEETENDTGETGNDIIPFRYNRTVEHTLCWEDEDVDAMHFMELIDSEGDEVLRLEVNGECVTEIIEAGDYVMIIHHDGRIETTYPIFIIPNPQDLEQASNSNGLINGLNAVVNVIQNTLSKDAKAQTAQDNLNTLISTNKCEGCYLGQIDLSRKDLSGADLSKANLTESNLFKVNLSEANLTEASLFEADLSEANLTEANLTKANLDFTSLTNANLTNAKLIEASFRAAALNIQCSDDISKYCSPAILSGADLSGAIMNNTHMEGVDLTEAVLFTIEGLSILGVNLAGAFMEQAVLTNANMLELDLSGADLTEADLSGAFLSGANLSGAFLINANLSGADLSGADLSGVNITGANLLGAVWCKSLVFFSATICTNSTTDACLGCLTDSFGCRSVEECT